MYQKDYKQALVDAAAYSGTREAKQRVFSASSLGSTVLQNYYRYQFGVIKDHEFGQNTLGSIFQLGVDAIFKGSEQYINSMRAKHTLDNGWVISGEIDQLDMKNRVIIDNKTTKTYKIKMLKKQNKDDDYMLQLAVYRWLLWKNGEGKDWKTVLACVDKQGGYDSRTLDPIPSLEMLEVETYTVEEIEAMLISKTDELDQWIELGSEPEVCPDRWTRRLKTGVTVDTKCKLWCSYKDLCKYYDPYLGDKADVSRLMGG